MQGKLHATVELDGQNFGDLVRQLHGADDAAKLRSSSERRSYLNKFASLMANESTDLRLAAGEGAYVELQANVPAITIPSDENRQPVTNLSEEVYDMLAQETLTLHEVGHILYTNWYSFVEYRKKVDEAHQGLFQQVWNAIEDGRMEGALRNKFVCENDFYILNENAVHSMEIAKGSGGVLRYTMFDAVMQACCDLAIHDSGKLDALIDDDNDERVFAMDDDREAFVSVLPDLRDAVADILSEPDSSSANGKIFDLWTQTIRPLLDNANASGKNQNKDQTAPENGKPDDSQNNSGDATEGDAPVEQVDVDSLPGAGDEEGEEDDEGEAGGSSGSDEGDEDGSGEGAGDDESDSSSSEGNGSGEGEESGSDDAGSAQGSGGSGAGKSDREEQAEQKYAAEIQREAENVEGQTELAEEAAALSELREDLLEEREEELREKYPNKNDEWYGAYVQGEIPVEVLNHQSGGDRARYEEATRRGKGLGRLLKQKLQQKERSRTKRNQTSGHFDTTRMMDASRGNARVMTRESRRDKPAYDCIVLLDRSGSMSGGSLSTGSQIESAENATGQLLAGLEEADIDSQLIGINGSVTSLEKPFGGSLDATWNNVFTSKSHGGTPLTQGLTYALERAEQRGRTPFVVVLTDGGASSRDEFEKVIEATNIPVFGIKIAITRDDEMPAVDLFTGFTEITSEQELNAKLKQLATQMVM